MKFGKAMRLFKAPYKKIEIKPIDTSVAIDFDKIRRSPVLFCDHRSGSNMFKQNLAKMSELDSTFEVLDPDPVLGRERGLMNFHQFLQAPSFPGPVELGLNGERVALEFMSQFVSQFNEPTILDLKYTHSHVFGVSAPFGHPIVLQALANCGCKFIHLVRRNFVKQAISQLVAAKTMQFQSLRQNRPESENGPNFWLDPHEVIRLASAKHEIVEHSKKMLKDLRVAYFRVTYEELTGDSGLDLHKRALSFVGQFSDVEQLPTVKAKRQLSANLVYNLEEIMDLVHKEHSSLVHGI